MRILLYNFWYFKFYAKGKHLPKKIRLDLRKSRLEHGKRLQENMARVKREIGAGCRFSLSFSGSYFIIFGNLDHET